jgi:hypothetical protein
MYENAYPFEHLVYVEMPQDDPVVQARERLMHKINDKWFYFIIDKDMALMQYTGLQDRDGVEICQDDYVQGVDDYATPYGEIYVVKFGKVSRANLDIAWMHGFYAATLQGEYSEEGTIAMLNGDVITRGNVYEPGHHTLD